MNLEEHADKTVSNLTDETKPRVQIPPGALVILPLRNTVLFPSTVMPLTVGRPSSLQAIEEAVRRQLPIGVVAQRDPKIEVPQPKDLYEIGTTADVLRMSAPAGRQRQIVIQGRQRFKILEFVQTDPFLAAHTLILEETVPQTREFEARIRHLREEASKALSLLPQPMAELKSMIESIEDPVALIDIIASTLDLSTADKQEILATLDVEARAQKVSRQVSRQVELLELSQKIRAETTESMEKAQREYFLREQLKAIQKELGEEEGKNAEIEELRKKIAAAKTPPEVEKEALRELARLKRISEMSPEYSVIRTYLDCIIELPWSVRKS
jgi:ATP-dependent Lon protease